jgi:hypothetical protein
MKPITLFERDLAAVRAYRRACQAGSIPSPDSPIAKAASRAVRRQEALDASTDFVVKALGETPVDQRMQTEAVAWGRRQAALEPPKLPVPDIGDAVARTRESLAGVGVVNMAGAGASTIETDQAAGGFLAELQSAEKARQLMADPATPEAMRRATQSARLRGRKPTAEDFSKALEEVKAAQGPRPYTPPPPVVPLLTGSATTTTDRYSVVPDSFRR